MNDLDQIDWNKGDGLVPAIVQHAITGRVLMLGYMNCEAFAATRKSGSITFFSRSRQRLWTKGETSGNTLTLQNAELDCDRDTLLLSALPAGPTCHQGSNSCFDQEGERPGFGFVGELEAIIDNRVNAAATGTATTTSYTQQLIASGTQQVAKKVGEEGVEVALAAAAGSREDVINESADLIFHLLVLLRQRDLGFADVAAQLQDRHLRG